jgi:hypothetical protein
MLVKKPEEKKLLESQTYECNIKMDNRETGC